MSDLRVTFVLNEVVASLARLRLDQSESASDRYFRVTHIVEKQER